MVLIAFSAQGDGKWWSGLSYW